MAVLPVEDRSLSRLDEDGFKRPMIPKKRKKVLEEEPYTKELERIIQRDFFPDVPKLKAQNEYLEAESRNDLVRIRELQMQYRPTPKRRPTTGTSDVTSASPLTFQSPATFETPASPATHGSSERKTGHKSSENSDKTGEDSGKDDTVTKEEYGLDDFLQRVTSEDNSSFEDIMEESEKKHKRKYPWLYENDPAKKVLAVTAGKQALAITDGRLSGNASGDIRPNVVDTWDYKAKNAVMQNPEGIPFTAEEIAEREKQKIVVIHVNTRFQHDPWKDVAISRDAAADAAGKIGPDGLEITTSSTPQVNGYRFMPSPSPAPGVGESPMMTWGEIEGTPFALDASDTPMLQLGGGPQFKIPEVPDRDKIHLELVDNVTKRHRVKRDEALQQVRSLASTPKFGSALSAERLANMSPAAQRLATTRLGIRLGTDKALNASYSPSPRRNTQTPLSSSIATPDKNATTPHTPTTPSITDNLLNIRKNPSTKK